MAAGAGNQVVYAGKVKLTLFRFYLQPVNRNHRGIAVKQLDRLETYLGFFVIVAAVVVTLAAYRIKRFAVHCKYPSN